MPSHARGEVFDPHEVNVLHCYCRFAQQFWLFGKDPKTGEDGTSRRTWLQELLQYVVRIFAIDIGFTHAMSNHYHLIIRNLPYIVEGWADDEVIRRWVQASHLTKSMDGVLLEPTEEQIAKETAKCQSDPDRIEKLRLRLANPSEFMKCVNENLGRRLNAASGTSGRVFEERFQAKPILGEAAQLVAALYVDLNAVRAGEVDRIEDSQYSSTYERLKEWLEENADETLNNAVSGPDDVAPNDSVESDSIPEQTLSEELSSKPVGDTNAVNAEAAAESNTTSGDTSPVAGTAEGVSPRQSDKSRVAPRAPRAAWLSPIQLEEGLNANVASGNSSSTPWRPSDKGWFSISFTEYLSFLDWSAREARTDKRGVTPSELVPILRRLGLNPDAFIDQLLQFRKLFRFAIGSRADIEAAAQAKGKRRRPLKATDRLFTSA